jgi:hypothetical protein
MSRFHNDRATVSTWRSDSHGLAFGIFCSCERRGSRRDGLLPLPRRRRAPRVILRELGVKSPCKKAGA